MRGHHQISVIPPDLPADPLRSGWSAPRITDDLQSMLDTMAREGGFSDYAHVAALTPNGHAAVLDDRGARTT